MSINDESKYSREIIIDDYDSAYFTMIPSQPSFRELIFVLKFMAG